MYARITERTQMGVPKGRAECLGAIGSSYAEGAETIDMPLTGPCFGRKGRHRPNCNETCAPFGMLHSAPGGGCGDAHVYVRHIVGVLLQDLQHYPFLVTDVFRLAERDLDAAVEQQSGLGRAGS